MNARTGHAETHSPGRARVRAFTLVELLTVIMIMALLAAILLPTGVRALNQGYCSQTRTRVKSLDAGCSLYRNDHGLYPGQAVLDDPARGVLGNGGLFTGSQVLASCMYQFDVASGSQQPRGIYDPFKAEFLGDIPAGPRPRVLADGFPKNRALAICYYPSRPGDDTMGQFRYEHNQPHTDFKPVNDRPDAAQQKLQFGEFVRDSRYADRPARSSEFLIIAAGAERKYFTGDNATNFGK